LALSQIAEALIDEIGELKAVWIGLPPSINVTISFLNLKYLFRKDNKYTQVSNRR
jgi:hypothetical protein